MAETGNLPGVEQAMMPEESDVFSSRFDYCQAENTLNIEYVQAVSGKFWIPPAVRFTRFGFYSETLRSDGDCQGLKLNLKPAAKS